jgi:N-acetylglutamate synthase-like GNAT family acetyltransferase
MLQSFFAKLAAWLKGPPRFQFPGGARAARNCRVRPLREADKPLCEEIYRLNEAMHFPRGFLDRFLEQLNSASTLFLVAELEGKVKAVAGLVLDHGTTDRVFGLAFGMVHPSIKRQGLGTTLLLARLAALPDSLIPCAIAMTSVGGSNTFYDRFGFRFLAVPPESNVHGLDHHIVTFSLRDKIKCEKALDGVQLERGEIESAFRRAQEHAEATAISKRS